MTNVNTPLSNRGVTESITNNSSDYYGKEVKIDWFQVTFDFIPVKFISDLNKFILDKDDPKFIKLIKLLNPKTNLINKDYDLYIMELIANLDNKRSGRFRFSNGYMLGEFIELSYGGNKTANDTFPVVLIMSGQACREFELAGGIWVDLFTFILKYGSMGHLKIGRLDIAIDDFDGTEITPYDIEPYIRNHHYISTLRKVNYNITESHSNNPTTDGFTITFGSRGSTMLQIYDKKLERRNKKEIDKNTKVWFRYEMRFYDDIAYNVLTRYLEQLKLDTSLDFMSYMKGVLFGLLDIKVENVNDKRRSRWKTLPAWSNFLNSFTKIDLKRTTPIETTINKKTDWFKNDMATTLLQFALVYDGEDFNEYIHEVISSADFKNKHLNIVNNHFKDEEKNIIDMEVVNNLQERFTKFTGKTDDELLIESLEKLYRLDYFNFAGAGDESNYFYLNNKKYYWQITSDKTAFCDMFDILNVNAKDVSNLIRLSITLKEQLYRLNKS